MRDAELNCHASDEKRDQSMAKRDAIIYVIDKMDMSLMVQQQGDQLETIVQASDVERCSTVLKQQTAISDVNQSRKEGLTSFLRLTWAPCFNKSCDTVRLPLTQAI
jgi:hypothetical protein